MAEKLVKCIRESRPHSLIIAVSATLEAGRGATGVSINPAQTLALVCNRSDGTVSIFKISVKTLTPAGTLQLGGEKSGPSHAAFTPDGKMALVSRDGDLDRNNTPSDIS